MSGLDHIRSLIAQEGPISIERYMELALAHPVFGYYRTRDPLGTAGDFTTAPEISQMFGELLGLWAGAVWQAMGMPSRFSFVELGPGRGSLMSDALRATRGLAGFHGSAHVHLVETSPVLKDRQAKLLAAAPVPIAWHETIENLPDEPIILIANEFLDALPIRQFQHSDGVWRERLVGLDAAGELCFGLAAEPETQLALPAADEASLFEISPLSLVMMRELAGRIARCGGAGLFIDYGHVRSGLGETLQALKAHRFVHPLDEPGEADLTAHVDFAAMAQAARLGGARVDGPIEQGAFLLALGLETRARRLMAGQAPEKAKTIADQALRLAGSGEEQMGSLFKVLGLRSAQLAVLPGFGG